MNCIALSHQILIDVFGKSKPFGQISRNLAKRNDLDSSLRHDANLIAASALRHYLVFKPIIDNAYPYINEEQYYAVLIHLNNALFSHVVSKTETIDYCIEIFKKYENTFDYKLFNDLTIENLIDSSIDRSSAEYISLRYNLPLWLCKMWMKHYKEKLTYLIVKSLNKKMDIYAENIEDSEPNFDEFISKYHDFERTSYPRLLKYNGKIPLNKTEAFLDCSIFATRPAVIEMFDNVDIDPARGIAVFQGSNYQYYLELVAKFSSRISFDLLCADGTTYYSSKKTLDLYKLHQVRNYESNASIMNLCISSKVHTFFLFPKCSEFSLLRTTPDYGLHFYQEQLDSILQEQQSELEEASKIVEDGGYLIYAIPTISKKESEIMIRNFLKAHYDFSLVIEKQHFPFDCTDSVFYYAILQKDNLNND